MKRLHYISGLIITLFIGLHLVNHIASVFGPDVHITFMNEFRLVYRNVIIETILLLVVFTQIITGIKLFFSKNKLGISYYQKWQIWSGIYLAFFLIIHVGAVMIGRSFLNLDTNFYFGVAGLNTFPFNVFFIPYYGFAILSFFGHVAAIHNQKMKRPIFGLTVDYQSRLIIISGIILSIIILYGLTNGFTGVEIPKEYNIMIGR